LVFFYFRSFDFEVVFPLAAFFSIKPYLVLFTFQFSVIDIICLFLFLGVVGKSAQFGLHGWLPEAMEGPTPVSALIHAATLVTAGVFLLVRCSFLFELSKITLFVILLLGGITAIFGASTAFFQNDIKKIIAFSTTSQLGYMVFSCGLSGYDVAMFHLINHAFFKSLLFLSAGSVIHAAFNDQDLRKYGNFTKLLPFSYICMLIGFLGLSGFPFFSGFYSKEVCLEYSFSAFYISGNFLY